MVLTVGSAFANTGIIVAGKDSGNAGTCTNSKDGIIVAGKDGIIVAGRDGIIVAGKDGIIVAGFAAALDAISDIFANEGTGCTAKDGIIISD